MGESVDQQRKARKVLRGPASGVGRVGRWGGALFASVLVAAVVVTSSVPAHAQAAGTMNVQSYRPSPFAQDILSVGTARVGEALRPTIGLNVHYTDGLLALEGTDTFGRKATERIVSDRLMAELLVGFAPADFLDIGLAMPLVLMGSSDLAGDGGAAGFSGFADPSGFRVGELRLDVRGQFYRGDHVGVGMQLGVSLPTGDADAFVGDGTAFFPKILLDFGYGPFEGAFNAGAVIRLEDAIVAPLGTVDEEAYFVASHQLAMGLGGKVEVYDGLDVLAEAYLMTQLTDPFGDEDGTAMETMLGVRYRPHQQVSLTLSGGGGTPMFAGLGTSRWRAGGEVRWLMQFDPDTDGDGVDDGDDRCPQLMEDPDGFEDTDGCPDPDNDDDGFLDVDDACPDSAEDVDGFEDSDGCPDLDNDADGVPDATDRCLGSPEDVDGFMDADGCPDLDNDKDGIPDLDDACPVAPETINGFEDADGCPDFPGVQVTGDTIRLTGPVQYARGGREVGAQSIEHLRNVARLIRSHPEWGHVRIDSHTDGRGSKRAKRKTAERRADAIRQVLVLEGVDPLLLSVRAVGPDEPVADDKTRAGRAANNRIEFVVLPKAP